MMKKIAMMNGHY